MTSIAILLTCFNRKDKTLSCLRSLYADQFGVNVQPAIFLVDDGSTDGTSEAVKSEFPNVNIIKGTGSLYWNRGMHLAWETAAKLNDYDFYLWLNDDVTLHKGAISELLNDSSKKPDSIVCASMQSSVDGSITYGGKDLNGDFVVPNGNPQKISLINGNMVLIPKSVFKKVGMLDPIFPHSLGDFEYGMRAAKQNIESYTASNYGGICDSHDTLPKWCIGSTPLAKRFKSLYSPLGRTHPYYFFIFEIRHFSLITAIKHFITIHIRVLFPSLWRNRSTFFK